MNSEPCRKIASSCRSESSTGRASPNMDFTLYGSPAPRCSKRSTPVRARRPSQPPNTPNGSVKARKPLRLPIEKILLLNERIEHTKREKIKMALSPRQIKLLSEKEDSFLKNSGKSCSAPSSSSPIDLSIDLSTVTSSDRESDTNSDDPEEFAPKLILPKKEACSESSTTTESPSRYVWHLKKPNADYARGSERSSASEYPCSAASKISETSATGRSLVDQSAKCFRSRSADLIHLYVSTINHKDKLTKYFRPCHVCSKACCICPDLVPESSRSFPLFSSAPTKFTLHTGCEGSKCIADKMIETDPEITEFGNPAVSAPEVAPDSGSESTSSEFSNFLVERYLKKKDGEYQIRRNDSDLIFDSGNSTLQFDDMNESDGPGRRNGNEMKKSIPLSVMQLATAAQCARILANSLESVLEIVDVDTVECKDLVRFKGDDLNQLCQTLLSLKSHYPEESSHGGPGLREEWVDFHGKEKCEVNFEESQQRTMDSLDDAFLGPVNTVKATDFSFEDNFEGKFLSLNGLSFTDENPSG